LSRAFFTRADTFIAHADAAAVLIIYHAYSFAYYFTAILLMLLMLPIFH